VAKKGLSIGKLAKLCRLYQNLNPFVSDSIVSFLAYAATGLEISLGVLLLTNIKIKLVAKVGSALLLLFALAMTNSNSIKGALDYSVFSAAVDSYAL
jgi:uncharacterized membrane protein YphA (DoxX/SURF4 family)